MLRLRKPALGQADWKDEEDDAKAILDFVVAAMLRNNQVITGLAVSDGGGLTANYAAGVVDEAGNRFTITASSVAVSPAGAPGEIKLNWIYVDNAGVVHAATVQPSGDYVPLALVDATETAISGIADLRAMAEPEAVHDNLLLNPAFQVNQDVYTFGTAIGTAYKYLLDGWFSDTVNGKITNNGDGTYTVTDLLQILADRADLDGVTVTVSAEVTDAGSLTVSAGGADSSSSLGTLTQIGSLTGSVGSLTFELDVGTKTWPVIKLSGSAKFKDLKVEVGSLRTPARRMSHGEELAKCQRQYYKTYLQSNAPGTVTNVGSILYYSFETGSSKFWVNVVFPVTMRVVPTLYTYSPVTGAVGKAYCMSDAADLTMGGISISESIGRVGNSQNINTVGHVHCHIVAIARP